MTDRQRALYFDLDGTLLKLRREYDSLIRDAYLEVEGTVPKNGVERYNKEYFDLFHQFVKNPSTEAFSTISKNSESLAEALLQLEIDATEPVESAHEDLAKISKNYKVGVITNGVTSWQLQKLRAFGLESYFDVILISYTVGAHKPSTQIYSLAEAELPAVEYAMVGDSESDIIGARQQGWMACEYERQSILTIPDALGW